MANRPVFQALAQKPFVIRRNVDFTFHSGFSVQQKQRSIASLHDAFASSGFLRDGETLEDKRAQILEISSKSTSPLGVALSAFNLHLVHDAGEGEPSSYPVECAFQSAKVFEDGGPFTDLLHATPRQAKRDPRLQESGKLVGFTLFGQEFPLTPTTFFYDWLYVNALASQPDLVAQLDIGATPDGEESSGTALPYAAFTDIEFNPKRSLNCQAQSVAMFCGLKRTGMLDKALTSPESFRTTVYWGGTSL